MSNVRWLSTVLVALAFAGISCYSGSSDSDDSRSFREDAESTSDAQSNDSFDAGSYRLDDAGDVAGAPEIDVPDRLDFARVARDPGTSQTREFTIANIGEDALVIESLSIENFGENVAFARAGEWPPTLRLLPGEHETLAVEFQPIDRREQRGRILLDTNDPRYRDGLVPIALYAKAAPCLEPERQGYEFDVTSESTPDTVTKTVRIENCGTTDVFVDDAILQGERQFFDIPGRLTETPYDIAAGDTLEFDVTAKHDPDEYYPRQALLEIFAGKAATQRIQIEFVAR